MKKIKGLLCAGVLTFACLVNLMPLNVEAQQTVTACQEEKYMSGRENWEEETKWQVGVKKDAYNEMLKAVPCVPLGKTHIEIPEKYRIKNNYPDISYVIFKCNKTGKYRFTCSNLQSDVNAILLGGYMQVDLVKKKNGLYYTNNGKGEISHSIAQKSIETNIKNNLSHALKNLDDWFEDEDEEEAYLYSVLEDLQWIRYRHEEYYMGTKGQVSVNLKKGDICWIYMGEYEEVNFITEPYYSSYTKKYVVSDMVTGNGHGSCSVDLEISFIK